MNTKLRTKEVLLKASNFSHENKNKIKARENNETTDVVKYVQKKSQNVVSVSPVKKRKIFYSEKQSKNVSGIPCVPPCTPGK